MADFVGTIANVAICCLFMMTMYQISISIRMIDGQIDAPTAKKRLGVLYVSTIGVFVLFCITMITMYSIYGKSNWNER